jgi:hypothetical protein
MEAEMKQNDKLNHLLEMINRFLSGEDDPLAFSYDLPAQIIEDADDIRKVDNRLFTIINEELPDICAWFDPEGKPGDYGHVLDLPMFKTKVKEQLDLILARMAVIGLMK